jgi:hypothetical protein
MDIFHDRQRFVPGGPAAANLWMVLNVTEPDLDDCIRFCRDLAAKPYGVEANSALMAVFRYMEHSDRRGRAPPQGRAQDFAAGLFGALGDIAASVSGRGY